MARATKQIIYRPDTIIGLLNRWDSLRPLGANVPKSKTLRMFGLPDSREEFTPNAAAMYGLLQGLSGSIRQHFAGTRANYNSFMSMYSRWKRDLEDFLQWKSEIAQHKRSEELLSPEYTAARDALDKPATGWVSYEAWLQMLGKAGVLDPAIIAAVPRTMMAARENMMRMYQEWLELEDAIEPSAATVPTHEAQMPGLVGKELVRGDVAIPEQIYNAVADVPEIEGITLDGMVEDTAIFNSYSVRNDIRANISGRVFINCVFNGVTFRGDTDGAMFIACDFVGDCRVVTGKNAENMTFKKCVTVDGVLSMPNTSLTGLRMYQCGGMKVNVRRACIGNSHIVDGWVDCGRAAHEKALWDGIERVAPRTINNAVWENGGLIYDVRGVPVATSEAAKATDAAFITATINAVIPANTRLQMVRNPRAGGTISRCGAVAEQVFEEDGIDTRELFNYPWELADERQLEEQAHLDSLRTRARGTAKTVDAERDYNESREVTEARSGTALLESLIMNEVNNQ